MKTSVTELRRALVALIALLLLAALPGAALAGQWGAPIDLPTGAEAGPMALGADGIATIIWGQATAVGGCSENPIPGCEVRVARLGANGWGAPVTLSNADADPSLSNVVAAADGTATAIWAQTDGTATGRSVWASRFSSGAWSTAVRLSSGAPDIGDPQLVEGPDGSVLALWLDNTTYATWWSQFVDGAWTTAAELTAVGQAAGGAPALLASPDGSFTLLLQQRDGQVVAARLAGGVWVDQGPIAIPGHPVNSLAAVVDSQGTITALWNTYLEGRFVLESARRVGGTWGDPDVVSAPLRSCMSPLLVVDAHDVVTAVWTLQGDDSPSAMTFARARAGTWSDPADVVLTAGSFGGTSMVMAADGPLLLAQDDATGQAYSLGLAGDVWSTPQLVVPGGLPGENSLAANAFGSALAVLIIPGTPDRVQAIRFGSVPLAPSAVLGEASERQIDARWTPPARSDAPPVRSYTATASPGGRSCSTTGGLRCTITGLTAGMTYRVTVVAANEFGTGPASAPSAGISVPAGPAAVIAAKRIVTTAADGSVSVRVPVTVPGPGEVTLNGTTSNGGGSLRSSVSRPVWRCTVAVVFAKAGTRTLTCRLRARARAQLRRGALRFAFETIYVPTGGVPVRSVARVNIARHR